MTTRNPPLKLVGKAVSGPEERRLNALNVESLGQLSRAERERVENIVKDVAPHSGILGVVRSGRPGDIRPVVVMFGEGGPSIIRFLGPEVILSAEATAQANDLFSRTMSSGELQQSLLGWGFFEGQIWFRRLLVEKTLSDHFASGQITNEEDVFRLALNIVDELTLWHSYGIAHGHLSPENISVDPTRVGKFLDSGVALTLMQAMQHFSENEFPAGYEKSSFAPEILRGSPASYAADIYGLGKILEQLFLMLRRMYDPSQRGERSVHTVTLTDIQALLSFCQRMLADDPLKRPKMEEIREMLANRGRPTLTAKAEKKSSTEEHQPRPRTARVIARHEEPEALVEKVPTASLPNERVIPTPAPQIEVYSQPAPVQVTLATPTSTKVDRGYTPNNAWYVNGMIFGSIMFFAWIMLGTRQSEEIFDSSDLQVAWESKIPSRMSMVAEAAVDAEQPNEFAETLILSSAMHGDEDVSGANMALLRIAYDRRWERSLAAEDKRAALTLSLAGLLGSSASTKDISLQSLHPGVIFALVATSSDQTASILRTVPLETLQDLPAPLGQAFQELLAQEPKLTCGDAEVRALAAIATQGPERAANIGQFLNKNADKRLRALAILFSHDNVGARRLLDTLLNHPALSVNVEVLRWAKATDLLNWKELESSDQVFMLAGMPPSAPVAVNHYPALLLHPLSGLMGYTLETIQSKISFAHPGADQVFFLLKKEPNLMSREQVAFLITLLQSPKTVPFDRVTQFLQSSPPTNVIALLLLASASEKEATYVDFHFMRYLLEHNWHPDLASLRKLSKHPDAVTRAFAYKEVFDREDSSTALLFFTEAVKSEPDPAFVSELNERILALRQVTGSEDFLPTTNSKTGNEVPKINIPAPDKPKAAKKTATQKPAVKAKSKVKPVAKVEGKSKETKAPPQTPPELKTS